MFPYLYWAIQDFHQFAIDRHDIWDFCRQTTKLCHLQKDKKKFYLKSCENID